MRVATTKFLFLMFSFSILLAACSKSLDYEDAKVVYGEIRSGRSERLTEFLNSGLPPDYDDERFGSLVSAAANSPSLMPLKALAEREADFDSTDVDGEPPPLVGAILSARCENAIFILLHDVDMSERFHGAGMGGLGQFEERSVIEIYEIVRPHILPLERKENTESKCWNRLDRVMQEKLVKN